MAENNGPGNGRSHYRISNYLPPTEVGYTGGKTNVWYQNLPVDMYCVMKYLIILIDYIHVIQTLWKLIHSFNIYVGHDYKLWQKSLWATLYMGDYHSCCHMRHTFTNMTHCLKPSWAVFMVTFMTESCWIWRFKIVIYLQRTVQFPQAVSVHFRQHTKYMCMKYFQKVR